MADSSIEQYSNANSYQSWHPDSHRKFKNHPEFDILLEKFAAGSLENNGGDIGRAWFFIMNVKRIITEDIPGGFAELGVYKGNTASILAYYATLCRRELFLFDTFAGFDPADIRGLDHNRKPGSFAGAEEAVRALLGRDARSCTFVRGRFPESVTPEAAGAQYAVVHIDCDLYAPIAAGLQFFYPRLAPGGLLMIHDYASGHWPGATQAVDEFMAGKPESLVLLPDKSGTALLRKAKFGSPTT